MKKIIQEGLIISLIILMLKKTYELKSLKFIREDKLILIDSL